MKILHCLWDDKFMDGTIRVYDHDSRHSNEYIFFTDSPEGYTFSYIKSNNAKIASTASFLSLANGFDVVVLHSFGCLKNRLISKIPPKCIVVWYSWGFDIYGDEYPIIPLHLYYGETNAYLENHKNKRTVKERLYAYKESLFLKRALSRVDYYSGVFPYEYDLIQMYHPYFKAKKLDFYYGDVDFFIKDTVSNEIEHGKQNIIIGNSADPRNNHHDALTILSKSSLPPEAKLIIPLSYAGTDAYVKWVKEYAETLFPGRVMALLEYMPLQVYLDMTSHCKVAIFYHERQQASDNIFLQMMYGAKVYMSETSLAYQYLKKEGFVVFSLQSEAETILDDMSDEMVMKNRKLLCEKYANHTIFERVANINQLIEKDIKGGKGA